MHFWISKLEGNRLRDVRVQKELRRLGWSCLVVWECELKNLDRISARISRFLVFKED
jgi:DNA mismatch endonuclease (patch repair protein)